MVGGRRQRVNRRLMWRGVMLLLAAVGLATAFGIMVVDVRRRLALLVALGALLALSPTLRLPLPILLVLGGVAMGFIPGLPHVTLPPEVVLVAVLPPLLYEGAFFTSLRDLRQNRRPIALLAIGLVAVTMTAVAVAAHEWIGLSWPVAFTLGAVVSPTDAIAATEIA